MTDKKNNQDMENEDLEISLLLDGIYRKYGYDFRDYSKAHLKRRVRHRQTSSNLPNISTMIHLALNDQRFFETLLRDLSINVTEMFRDPAIYSTIRSEIIPFLETYPFIKVWHAGCSTGEEVYSMAIMLHEEGLLPRSQIYATDFNQTALEKAKKGIFPLESIKHYTANYQKSGGRESFSDYYTAGDDEVILSGWLKKQIVFADHNLVTDTVFSEVNLVICRNVLIYFNRDLQNKIFKTFCDSLCDGGYLWLGSKESLRLSPLSEKFEAIFPDDKIYKKRL